MSRQHIEAAIASLQLALESDADTLAPPPTEGGFALSARSLKRMNGMHPDLQAVVQYAIRICPVDFGIPKTGGVRDRDTQRHLVDTGKSGTMRSRHLSGHAVDVFAFVDGKATWNPTHILAIHAAFETASKALAVPLRWGGDWDGDGDIREKGENDLVHHELPRAAYGIDPESLSPAAAEFLRSVAA